MYVKNSFTSCASSMKIIDPFRIYLPPIKERWEIKFSLESYVVSNNDLSDGFSIKLNS